MLMIHSATIPAWKTLTKGCLALLCLSLAACSSQDNELVSPASGPVRARNTSISRDNTVQVGESIELFVMEDSQFNGSYKVREQGDIIIPKLGRVNVAGKSVDGAQAAIKAALESSQLKSATVIADRVGAVAGTNFSETPKLLVFMIAVENGNTLYAYEAFLIAGGAAPFADERKAYILRRAQGGARQKVPIDLRAIRLGSGKDVPLMEGDMLCVPEKRLAF